MTILLSQVSTACLHCEKTLQQVCVFLFFFFKGQYSNTSKRSQFFVFFLNFGFVCLFVCLFMALLGLHFYARAFSSCGKWGPLFIAVRGPLIIAASLVAEHRLQTRRLSYCGSRAQLLRGMWDPARPGLEPVSPALAGRLSTTAPPGKPQVCGLNMMRTQFKKEDL